MPVNTEKKNDKFSILTMVLMIILCIASIVCVIFVDIVGSDDSKKLVKKDLNVEELNEGWINATSGESFDNFGNLIEEEKIVLEHNLKFAGEKIEAFGFSTYYSAVKVAVVSHPNTPQESVIELESYGVESSEKKKFLGNYYLIVHIPFDVDKEGTLRVTFYNEHKQIYVYGFEYGSESDLTEALFFEYFSVIITLILAIVFVVVLLSMKVSKRTGKFITLSYVYFTLYFFIFAVVELVDSQFLMILGFSANTISFIESELYRLMPIGLLQFTNSVCRWKKRGKVINIGLFILILANFVATNIAVFTDTHTFIELSFSAHTIFALVLFNNVFQVFANWIRSFNQANIDIYPEKKFLGFVFLGGTAFAISSVAQMFLTIVINPSVNKISYVKYGIIAFGILIIYSIVIRINDAVDAERKENMNKIWAEKQKVEDIRSIMIEAFRTIIPDQYIEDVIEAYKKKNIIKNNSADGTVPEEEMILKIGHSRRLATILVSDIRGFSEISTKYDQRVGDMLSHYLGRMTDIVEKYGGHVLEFMGDGILAGFGTIEQDKYQADNAVKAAIEMQNTMVEINNWNEANGFPGQLEIGIGINTGNVFAGIIGSLGRFKFDVLGREVNLASRIESFTAGGQVLIAQKTKESIIEPVGTYDIIKATPKGFDTEQTYYLVNAVGDMKYEIKGEEFTPFKNPIEVKFSVFEDKGNAKKTYSGTVIEMSEHAIIVKTTALLDIFDIVKVIHNGGVTCKVTKIEERGYTFRFTSSNKRNDGRPIFEDQVEENNQYDELDAETKKLMKKKKEDYTF